MTRYIPKIVINELEREEENLVFRIHTFTHEMVVREGNPERVKELEEILDKLWDRLNEIREIKESPLYKAIYNEND